MNLLELGNDTKAIVGDLSSKDGIKSLAQTETFFGHVDILVNNAGM